MIPFIPETFPALALAHFLALLSPGPDFFLVVGHAIRNRLRGTVFICAGIAFGNGAYIVLSIFGWSVFKHSPALYRCMEFAGAAYLLWMGYMLARSGKKGSAALSGATGQAASVLSPCGQFFIGLGSALLNPKNAVFYLSLMTVIIGQRATLAQSVFCGAWMTSLVFVWDVVLASVISHPQAQRVLKNKIPLVEKTAGAVLALTGVSIVVSACLYGE